MGIATKNGIFLRAKTYIYRADQIRSMSLAVASENKFMGILFVYTDGTNFRLITESEAEARTILDETWKVLGGKE